MGREEKDKTACHRLGNIILNIYLKKSQTIKQNPKSQTKPKYIIADIRQPTIF